MDGDRLLLSATHGLMQDVRNLTKRAAGVIHKKSVRAEVACKKRFVLLLLEADASFAFWPSRTRNKPCFGATDDDLAPRRRHSQPESSSATVLSNFGSRM